jgi:Rho termination factor, N-terminal domain
MDLKELRRLPMPKLRDLAKAETELQGVGGMEKEDLIKAIAKAKNIPYDVTAKDVNAIHSIKHDLRELKKQKGELLTSAGDSKKLKKVQRKIKRLKRLTRHLAREAKTAQAAKEAAPAEATTAPAAPAAPAAPETPPAT